MKRTIPIDKDITEEQEEELLDKYWIEDNMCRSNLSDLLNEYRKLLGLDYD